MPRLGDSARSRWWVLLPLGVAVACIVASFFLPVHVGNWFVLAGFALVAVFFLQATHGRGGRSVTPFTRRR